MYAVPADFRRDFSLLHENYLLTVEKRSLVVTQPQIWLHSKQKIYKFRPYNRINKDKPTAQKENRLNAKIG